MNLFTPQTPRDSTLRNRILLIAMADSVHVARWLNSISDLPLDVLLFSSSPNRVVHNGIEQLSRESHNLRVKVSLVSRYLSVPIWLLDSSWLFGGWLRGALIAYYSWKLKPDCIQVMESQNSGYSYVRATTISKNLSRVPMALTLFGSDLFWFSRFPSHRNKLEKLMSLASALATEGVRDKELAKNLGFAGKYFTCMPVSGGIRDEVIPDAKSLDVLGRRTIAIKGYSNSLGVGENALKAVQRSLHGQAQNWKVEVFSAQGKALRTAKLMQKAGYDIVVHKKHELTHGQVLELLRRSRVFVGVSRSDGLPASFLEAMSQGAFPIQSNSSVASDWVESGVSGILVDCHAIDEIAKAINIALSDDDLVIEAAKSNLATIQSRAANSQLRQIIQREFGEFVGVEDATG